MLAAMMGLPLETSPGQPPRSSPTVALELRNTYLNYLAKFEDVFYSRLWQEKQKQPPPRTDTPGAAMVSQMALWKRDPSSVYAFIRLKEDATRAKFRKSSFGFAESAKSHQPLTEDQKAIVFNELRSILPMAKELQEKMPRYLVLAADKSEQEVTNAANMISMVGLCQASLTSVHVYTPCPSQCRKQSRCVEYAGCRQDARSHHQLLAAAQCQLEINVVDD